MAARYSINVGVFLDVGMLPSLSVISLTFNNAARCHIKMINSIKDQRGPL